MSSLSKAVHNTRRFLIAFVIFAVIIMIIQVIGNELNKKPKKSSNGSNSSAYQYPNHSISTYSRLTLDSLSLTNKTPSEFVVIGKFSKFPSVINIYDVNKRKIRLSSLEEAAKIANLFKLDTNYIKIDTNNYTWKGGDNSLQFNFNIQNQAVKITSDLLKATRKKVINLPDKDYISNAIRIVNTLGLAPQSGITVTGRVDYIAILPTGKETTQIKQNSSLVKVTLYKVMESATLRQKQEPKISNSPSTIVSPIYRPDILSGYIEIIFNNKGTTLDDIVSLNYTPSSYTASNITSQNTTNISPFKKSIYPALELGQAFENIKNKSAGVYLLSLHTPGQDLYSKYTPLSVAKFNIDAAKTKTVYIEPSEWNHLSPNVKWDAHIYPFYWFQGKATLDNGDIADFVFLVDTVPSK